MTSDSLTNRTKKGAIWAGAYELSVQAFKFAVGVALARILVPEDFGVAAIASVFMGIAGSVSRLGLSESLIQRKELSKEFLSTALLLNLAYGLGLFVLLSLLSPLIGVFFHNDLAGKVLAVLSLIFVINSFGTIPSALLVRSMDFKRSGLADLLDETALGLSAVGFALMGWGVWSIVAGKLVGASVRTVLLNVWVGGPPRFGYDRSAMKQMFSFGIGISFKNILNYLAINVDNIVIGRRMGVYDLGVYSRAYNLMTFPLNAISAKFRRVLFPAFAQVQHDNAKIRRAYTRVLNITSLISFPILTGIYLVAPSFINVVYGPKWLGVVVPLQVMCAAGGLKSVTTFCGVIVNAKGDAWSEVKRQGVYLVCLTVGVLVGSRWGIVGVSAAVLIVSVLMWIMMQSLLNTIVEYAWKEALLALLPSVTYCFLMFVVVRVVQGLLQLVYSDTSVQFLAASAVTGVVTYLCCFPIVRFQSTTALVGELRGDLSKLFKNAVSRPM